MLANAVVCVVLFLSLCGTCCAQHFISRDVIVSGGSEMGNAAHRITGTAGQPVVGVSTAFAWRAGQGFWYQVQRIPTSAEELLVLPVNPVLHQNYPNPFNPRTTIEFILPRRANVRLEVYSSSGRLLGALVDGIREAGRHHVLFTAGDLPAGVYLSRLSVGSVVCEQNMLLLK